MAHYWTGGLSPPRPVPEISLSGAVIGAPDSYYPGTLIRFALEDTVAAENPGEAIAYAGVWGRVLRYESAGFCVAFVFESRAERTHFRRFLEQLKRRGLDETNGNQTKTVRGTVTG